MMLKKERIRKLLFCLGVSIAFCIPLFATPSIYAGHDLMFHVSRIEALADAMRQGDWFPRLFFYQNYNYGYGTPLFYSNLWIYLPAFLTYCGLNVIVSYKWFLFTVTFCTSWFMFTAVKWIAKSTRISVFATILYAFGSYRITDVYVRAAVGEYLAFMIIPVLLLGTYELIHTEKRVWPILSVGFACLLLAHNISFVLICIAFGIYVLCNIQTLLKRHRWKELILSIVFGIGLVSFFVFPMLEQLSTGIYIVNGYFKTTPTMMDSLLSFGQLFQIQTTYGYLYTHQNVMNMSVGIPLIVLVILGLWIKRKNKSFLWASIAMIGILLMTTKYFPWSVITPLWFIQFSCRLLVIAFPIMTILASIVLEDIWKAKKLVAQVFCVAVCGITVVQFIPVFENGQWSKEPSIADRYLTEEGFSIKNTLDALSGQEYLPKTSTFDYDVKGMIIESNSTDSIRDFSYDYDTITFSNTPQGTVSYIMPLVFYKGYQVHLYQNGQHIRDVYPFFSDTGLLMFQTEGDGTSDTFVVTYGGTPTQKWSMIATMIAIVAYGGLLWAQRRKKEPKDEMVATN